MFTSEENPKMEDVTLVRYGCLACDLSSAFEMITGVQPLLLGQPAAPSCDYCGRPNLNHSETCNGCGAPSNV